MSLINGRPAAVLCDFDGTATPGEVIGLIYSRFASGNCDQFVQQWLRGEISTPDELRGCFATIKATREEMETELAATPLDPGFPALVEFCRQQGYPFAILSDGLRWFIDYILQQHDLHGLTVFANEITFKAEGYALTFPWYSSDTPRRGTSKPMIIQRYQAEGYKVIFIGDGLSDIEAVKTADVVFAQAGLLEYCVQNGIPSIGFSDLSDLLRRWKPV